MEEKEITEQESLALISQMIKKTNKQMRTGSGNFLLAWGWLLFLVSLIVGLLVVFTHNGMWMWGYFAIFVIGCPMDWLMNRKKKSECPHTKTYMEEVIGSIWKCVGAFLIGYTIIGLLFYTSEPKVWEGMWVLGILLPALGSYTAGVILKVKGVKSSALFGAIAGMFVLADFLIQNPTSGNVLFIFPLATILSMIIPGYLINRQAKRLNAE